MYRTGPPVHVWSRVRTLAVEWSYLVGPEGKMGKVSIRRTGQGRAGRTAGGVNTEHFPHSLTTSHNQPHSATLTNMLRLLLLLAIARSSTGLRCLSCVSIAIQSS